MKHLIEQIKEKLQKIIMALIAIVIFTTPILGVVEAAPEDEQSASPEASAEASAEATENAEETQSVEEQVIDISQCIEIKGDKDNGYYLQFIENIDEKVQTMYDANRKLYEQMGVKDAEIFKEMIKAEAATEYPNLGGVVTSSDPISNGTEAPAGGNESGASSTTSNSSSQGGVSIDAESFVFPQQYTFPFNITGGEDFGYRDIGSFASTNHDGIDLNQLPEGSPVMAAADGTVKIAELYGAYGYYVEIDHGNGISTFYGHMQPALQVTAGQKVTAGTVVGYQSGTGTGGSMNYGSHLHFGCHVNDQPTDPLSLYQGVLDIQLPNPSIDDSTSGTISLKSGVQQGKVVIVPSGNTSGGATVSNGTSKQSGTSSNQNAKITIGENKNLNGDENRFQGSVKLRRLTPTKTIGAYENGLDEAQAAQEIFNDQEDIPGMGTATEITPALKVKLKQASLSDSTKIEDMDDLIYLTIPYIDFNDKVRTGHMIVNKNVAKDVLNIFFELYSIRYPIESIQIAENFYEGVDVEQIEEEIEKEVENKNKTVKESEKTNKNNNTKTDNRDELGQASADNNNTCALYYNKYDASNHMTGNAIDLNPRYNPKTIDSGRRTETFNASEYVDRTKKDTWDQYAQRAYIDKESQVYKIFEKYGWTWGGDEGDYGHFEKGTVEDSNPQQQSIESRYCDLSYVDEQVFNSYVKTGDKRALYVYTMNSSRDVIVASWNYNSQNEGREFTITKSTPIGFRNALHKYSMPVELLNSKLVHSKDVEFVQGLVDLGVNSKYVVTIKDKVQTTRTNSSVTTQVTEYDDDGKAREGEEQTSTTDDIISEQASQTPEVTYVDNWFIKYVNNFAGATANLTSYDIDLSEEQIIKVNGTVLEETSNSTNTTNTYVDVEKEKRNQEQANNGKTPTTNNGLTEVGENPNAVNPEASTNQQPEKNYSTRVTTKVDKGTVTLAYSSSEGQVIENYDDFVNLCKLIGPSAQSNVLMDWIQSSLERNAKTVDLIEVLQMLYYKINEQIYTIPETAFIEVFKPDDFSSVAGNSPSGKVTIEGDTVEAKVWNALTSAGYSETAVAAVMGNIYGESSFNPGIVEGGSGIGFGLCQWSFDRRTQLEAFAASRGVDPADANLQIEFLLAELDPNGGADGFASYQFSGYESERQTWMTTSDIGEATTAFCAGFERPSVPRNETRIEKAQEYYNSLHK